MKKLICTIVFVVFVVIANAQVKTELINYKGWENSIQLSNSQIKVVVVPQIGRIMYLGFLNGENILYENQKMAGNVFSAENPYKEKGKLAHAHFGGDRIWPTVQDAFVTLNGSRGLSDPWIDGSPWNYKLVEDGVKIESRVSDYIGVKVSRTITLSHNEALVNIQQKMEKIKAGKQQNLEPIPVTLWSLSQIKNPLFGLLPIRKNSVFENGIDFQKWPDNINSAPKNYSRHGDVGQLIPVKNLFQKMGTDSRGWVAGVYKDLVFAQFFSYDKNKTYPDGGTSATVFTCTDFTELECLSPEEKLKPGESIFFNVEWKLKKISASNPDECRNQAIKWLNN